MNPSSEVDRLLREHNAVLKREKNHEVWSLPNGKTFVRAMTASDWRAPHNQLSDLRRALGIEDERGKPGERRERKAKPGNRTTPTVNGSGVFLGNTLADQLRVSGATEEALRDEIVRLQDRISRQRQSLSKLQEDHARCWMCRLRKWWRAGR